MCAQGNMWDPCILCGRAWVRVPFSCHCIRWEAAVMAQVPPTRETLFGFLAPDLAQLWLLGGTWWVSQCAGSLSPCLSDQLRKSQPSNKVYSTETLRHAHGDATT